jgi:hypothetical protein
MLLALSIMLLALFDFPDERAVGLPRWHSGTSHNRVGLGHVVDSLRFVFNGSEERIPPRSSVSDCLDKKCDGSGSAEAQEYEAVGDDDCRASYRHGEELF